MKKLLNRGLLGLLVFAASSCGAHNADEETLSLQRQTIVGGSEAWLGSAVALTTSQCNLLPPQDPAGCSGLLISPTTVLTARHCVSRPGPLTYCPAGIDPNQPSTFRVAVGCHDILNDCPAANWKAVADTTDAIVTHPIHDIAIVHLAQPVAVMPTRLASPARVAEIVAGDSVTLYGWGMTAETGYISPVLRSIERPILWIPYRRPGFPFDPGLFSTSSQTNPYSGTHLGDSGGPALVLRDGEWFSLGVITAGAYGSSGTDLVLVPHYFQWLLDHSADFAPQSWLPSAQIAVTTTILG